VKRSSYLIKNYFSPKNLEEALKIQEKLRRKLKIKPLKRKIEKIAGFDASFKEGLIKGGAVVIDFKSKKVLEERSLIRKIGFPYIPGLFAFREGPIIIELFYSLKNKPDLLILDAQGIAHPKGVGLASQAGLVLNTPSLGVSKTNLYGYYKQPPLRKGSFSFIYHLQTKEKIGIVLRTKDNTKPLFISPGNLLTLRDCLNILLPLLGRFRMPEILRIAHRISAF